MKKTKSIRGQLLTGPLADKFQAMGKNVERFNTWREQEKQHLDAYFEFLGILEAAEKNSTIKRSNNIAGLISYLVKLFGEAPFNKFDQLEEILSPVVRNSVSKQAKDANKKSHAGRAKLEEDAKRLFLERETPWNSIAEAVAAITPELLEKRNVSRPLGKGNASRTVREWLSDYVNSNEQARGNLTDKAQARLRKSKQTDKAKP